MRKRWVTLAVAVAAGALAVPMASCASGSTAPPGDECNSDDQCETDVCVDGRCVAMECEDADGDGAGIGPGCEAFDCDDTNPAVRVGVPEECENEIDENCEGSLDDGCPCLDETGATIPDGTSRDCGTSACPGTQTCATGLWGPCDAPTPEPEVCFDGLDNDCDGVVDNGCCSGCTAAETERCKVYACGYADQKCTSDLGCGEQGNGCTAEQTQNCAAFRCGCVDGECNGGHCPGTGCTPDQIDCCAASGCACVDGECSGGSCPGTGCTALEIENCAGFGCNCVDHQCSGGIGCGAQGNGCTAKEITDCAMFGCDCYDHSCRAG